MTTPGFYVQKHQCPTCIYRKDSPLDVQALEADIADRHMPGYFRTYRICHHAADKSGVCCAGFWRRHSQSFTLGQIAQRLKMVKFVTVDVCQERKECP